MTAAQRKALLALPSDGSWAKATRNISAACASLIMSYPHMAEWRSGTYGPRGGWVSEYRLTPNGIAEQRAAQR